MIKKLKKLVSLLQFYLRQEESHLQKEWMVSTSAVLYELNVFFPLFWDWFAKFQSSLLFVSVHMALDCINKKSMAPFLAVVVK
jgi:hypothetical protein